MREPEWIIHDECRKCPTPYRHDVEVRFNDGTTARDNDPEGWWWDKVGDLPRHIVAYRDWTAFEIEQKAKGQTNRPSGLLINCPEMTLRDLFAVQAMMGILAGPRGSIAGNVIEASYNIADRMLEQRKTQKGETE